MIHGRFRPNGGSGIVSGSTKGKGYSVARTSAGLYTVTFDDTYNELVSCKASVRVANASPTICQMGDWDATAKTLQIRVLQASTGAVTLTKPKGTHNLDIAALREIFTNDIGVAADGVAQGSCGMLGSDTTPALARINGATDKALRVIWAATVVDEVQFPAWIQPEDLDETADVVIKLLIGKGTNTDTTATVDVQVFNGIADTECGGATNALASSTPTEYSVTVAAADISGEGIPLNICLVPSAHANDAIHLYGARIEYTRTGWSATETGQVFALTDMSADADAEVEFDAIFRNTSVDY
jgi:hypothetical protein